MTSETTVRHTVIPKPHSRLLLALLIGSGLSLAHADDKASEEASAETEKAAKPAKPKRPPSLVGVDMVRKVPMVQTIPLIGRVVSKEAGPVASQVSGPVKSVKVNVGDRVEKGQVLSELDGEAQRAVYALREAELAQSQADVEAKKTIVELARSELKRAKTLRGRRAISESEYMTRVQSVAKANAETAQAEASVMRARVNLAIANRGLQEINLRAPYAGVVSVKHTSPGAWVNSGSPVVTLINDSELEVEADVPSSRLGALKAGVDVRVKAAQQVIMTKIRAVVPSENPASKTRVVRFSMVGTIDAQLAENQGVVVNIPSTTSKDVLTIHKDAVIRSAYGPMVYVVENNVAQMKMVQLGEPVGSRFVVNGGVDDKAMAVTLGNERIGPGTPVMIKR